MTSLHRAARAAALTLGTALFATVGPAQSSAAGGNSSVSEIRLGAAIHDSGPFSHGKENGADINGEVLFRDLGWLNGWHGELRPHLGATINTAGDTSALYFGLTATFDLTKLLFVEGSVGGAAHNGKHHSTDPNRKEFGCTVLFRESAGFGVKVSQKSNVMVYLDHISNANICSKNEGMETLGVRYGYRF